MKKRTLLLVASTGGHVDQLYSLKPLWEKHNRIWVTFDTVHGRSLLKDEKRVVWAHHPTNRNLKNLIKNIFLAIKMFRKNNITHVISTGAGVGVPFIWIGKLHGVKTIFIDSLTRTAGISLSMRLVYWITDYAYTQWPENTKKYKKLINKGKVI